MTGSEYTIAMFHDREATRGSALRTYGLLCAAGGVIATAGALWSTTVDPVVPVEQMSYPFSAGTFRVTEVIWTLTHVLTFFGALALARSGWAGSGRLPRFGIPLMLTGMALLVPAELAFVTIAGAALDSGSAVTISSLIGLAATLAGLGFTLTGVAILRERRWAGLGRWTPLLVGVFELTVLTVVAPMSGTVFLLGIAAWNLCLTLLGVALVRSAE